MNVVEILITGKNLSKTAFAEAKAEGSSLGSVLGKVGLVGAAALAGIAVEAVKMGAKFDSEMSLLQTQAGVSADKMAGLKKGVLDLAGQVGFGPTSLAESLFHVESNFESMGISSAKALQLVKIAAEGAATGHANLVDVTNALTAAVASGIPGVQDFSQAMGVLNGIVGVGDMNMQQLAQAFGSGMVATVKGFGLSITDVGAALAVFGDNNIRGSLAGNQLRMSVMALAHPIATAGATLKTLGLQSDTLAKDMQQGGLLQALDDLQQRMQKAGIGAKEQGDIITQAFGRKAGAGLNVLMDQMDRLRSKYPALQDASKNFGAAWAGTQMTLTQQWHELQAGFDAMMIRLGEKLTPAVTGFLSYLHDHGLPIVHEFGAALGQIGSGFGGVKTPTSPAIRSHNRFDYMDVPVPKAPDLTAWQKVGQFIRGVANDFATFAGQVAQSLSNLWKALQPTLKDLGIGLLGALKLLGVVLANVVGPALEGITGFLASHKALVEGVVIGWLAFKGAVLGYTLVVKGAELATKLWTIAQAALDVVLDANPIALVVGAIALLVAGFYELYKHSELVRIAVGTFFDYMKAGAGNMAAVFLTVIKGLVDAWLFQMGLIVKGAAMAFGWVPGLGGKLKAAARSFDDFTNSVNGKLQSLINKANSWAQAQANAAKERELKIRIKGWQDNLDAALAKLKTVTSAPAKAKLTADITSLQVKIANAQRDIDNLHGKTVTINTTIAGPGKSVLSTNAHGGVVSTAATGGARGALTWVGEQGPELVRLPFGSMVYPSGQSKMMAGQGGGGGPVVIELRSSGSAMDEFLLQILRRAIRVQGGNVQTVLGRG